MKRTLLKRSSKPLRQKTRMKQRRDTRRKSERVYDTSWMLLVKRLPCCAAQLDVHTTCQGVVEADHAGLRPMGRKCSDKDTIPLCSKHHRERTDFRGTFKTWDGARMRAWLDAQIEFARLDVEQMMRRTTVEAEPPKEAP